MLEKTLTASNFKLLPINLQLFAEKDVEEVSDDVDSVVDYPEDAENVDVDFPEIEEGEEEEEVAEPLADEESEEFEEDDEEEFE